jgi:PhoH-like ATPase
VSSLTKKEDTAYMKKTITVDTNLLLDDEKIIFKLLNEYEKIIIPITVLKELDKHKFNPNLSFSARNAIRALKEFKTKYPNQIDFPISDHDISKNDARIIEATKKENADLATKDISMSMIAEAQGVDTILYDVVMNNLFEPYHYVTVREIYQHREQFEWQRFYQKQDYTEVIELFSEVLDKELDKDAWFFIFIQAENIEPYIYANNPIKGYLTRVDHHSHYREIKCDNGRVIKARDIYQVCAIYALKEAPHVLLTGRWGSGKSLLTSAYTLEDNAKKAFITRPPIGINSKYNIGYVPGDKEEKMVDWLAGFTSALYYIYGNTNGQTDGKNSYDYVKDSIFNQKYEVLPLNSIQGLSLLDDDMLLIDEVQLISVDYMSMILSRPTENGKLIMMGDLAQSYDVVKPSESGLLKLLRALPHRSMAYVRLENSYRSDILDLADKLQDKTFVG